MCLFFQHVETMRVPCHGRSFLVLSRPGHLSSCHRPPAWCWHSKASRGTERNGTTQLHLTALSLPTWSRPSVNSSIHPSICPYSHLLLFCRGTSSKPLSDIGHIIGTICCQNKPTRTETSRVGCQSICRLIHCLILFGFFMCYSAAHIHSTAFKGTPPVSLSLSVFKPTKVMYVYFAATLISVVWVVP